MSKYDKEREALGLGTVGGQSSSIDTTSKYAKEREALFNPPAQSAPVLVSNESAQEQRMMDQELSEQAQLDQQARNNAAIIGDIPTPKEKQGFFDSAKEIITAPFRERKESAQVLTGQQPLVERNTGHDLADFGKGIVNSATLGLAFQDQEPTGPAQFGEALGTLVPFGLAAKAVTPLVRGIANPFLKNVTRGAIAGGLYGGVREGTEEVAGLNDQTATERLNDVGLDVGLGVAADVGLGLLGRGSRAASRASTENLLGGETKGTAAGKRLALDVIPEATPSSPVQPIDVVGDVEKPQVTKQMVDEALQARENAIQQYNSYEQKLKNKYGNDWDNKNHISDTEYSQLVQLDENAAQTMRASNRLKGLFDATAKESPDALQQGQVAQVESKYAKERSALSQSNPEEQAGGSITNPQSVVDIATPGNSEQMALDYIRTNPTATTNEIQRLFKLGYTTIQTLKDAAKAGETVVPKVAPDPIVQPKPPTVQRGTRANYATTLRNENLSDELQQGLKNADQTYEIKTNKASVAAADEALKDMSEATAKFLNNEAGGPEHIATGYKLMLRLDQLGKHEEALAVYNKLAADLTKGGQTSQAGSLISRLSAERQLLNLVRKAAANGKVVTVEDSIKFKELAAKVQEKTGAGLRENEFNEILNRMEKGENVSVKDFNKLSDFLADTKTKKSKAEAISDDLPKELKDTKTRDKVISYMDEVEKAALARIAARKSKVSSMVLPDLAEFADHTLVVAAQITKGTIKAATHVEDLVKLFGEEIRPVASQVFQKAQGLTKSISRSVGRDDIERAETILDRATGKKDAQRAVVEEMANHVKKLIADAKAGTLDPADIQTLRDYSDEIAEMTKGAKVRPVPTQEERFLQSVKALAKKIAEVETEKIPTDQANREVAGLLRQVAKIADEGTPKLKAQPIDNQALSDIAHDVMEKSRPNPEPKTLQEKIVEKFLKQNPTVSQKDIDSLRKLAKNVTKAAGAEKIDADIAMQRILNNYEKSKPWDKVQALRYIGMLLNTHTQLLNAASGPIMATKGTVEDIFGTMLDIAMHHTLKTPRSTTLYGTNPLRFIGDYLKNLMTGAKAGWHGVNPEGIQSTNEIRGLAFPSLKNPLTFIPSLMERSLGAVAKGADYATYKTVYDSEIVKQGFLDAKNKGIKGSDNIKKHVQSFVNDPSEAAILQADRVGKNTTFQRSDTTGGKVANFLNSAPPLVKPGVNAVFPFVRTPLNIASHAVTMTPAGVIKGLYQLTSKSDASRREAIRTLSMGVTGTGIGALGFYLMNIGIITGANDSGDKDVDNVREQAGLGKYRFNTSALKRYLGAIVNGEGSEAAEKKAKYQKGDEQFDYNKLQPLALPFAAGASLADNKDKSIVKQVAKSGEDSFGSLFGMSTLKGVQNVFQPSYGGTQGEKSLGVLERVGESFLKSFSWSGLAQEARRQDPIQRNTPFNDGISTNTTEYFKSRIPGLSQDLPARKTTLGQDYKNAPGIQGSYLNPYKSEVAPYNEAAEIIAGLIERTGDTKLAPTPPEKSIIGTVKGERTSIKIPTKRYETLQEDIGDEIVKRILALKGYSDDKLAVRIEDIYTKVRKQKMDEVKREFGMR